MRERRRDGHAPRTLKNGATNINARYGVEAVVGSTTEVSGNTFDLFVAIPAPSVSQSNLVEAPGAQLVRPPISN